MSICVSFPTIMDGLVLRWYADEASYRRGRELATASRNYFETMAGCTDEIRRAADQAHSYLTVEYAGSLHPRLDVSRWVTHKAHFASDELTPLAAAERNAESANGL